jgi:integrase
VIHNGPHTVRHFYQGDLGFLQSASQRPGYAGPIVYGSASRPARQWECRTKIPKRQEAVQARGPKRVKAMLTRDEIELAIFAMDGGPILGCSRLYGAGLESRDGLGLRTKDLDCGSSTVTIRDEKGHKDRATMLRGVVQRPLRDHLRKLGE